MENITEEQYQKAYEDAAKHWEEINDFNRKVFQEIEAPEDEIEEILYYCDVTGKIEIVDSPKGDVQIRKYKFFTSIYVDQYSVGDSGDSFAGHIYAEYGPEKWLKIPYEC
jgi:hypothetical protein